MASELGQPVADMSAQLQRMKLDTERAAQSKALSQAQARAMYWARRTGRKVTVAKAP